MRTKKHYKYFKYVGLISAFGGNGLKRDNYFRIEFNDNTVDIYDFSKSKWRFHSEVRPYHYLALSHFRRNAKELSIKELFIDLL